MKRRMLYVSHFQSGGSVATTFAHEGGRTNVYLGIGEASFTRLWRIALHRQVNPFSIYRMPGWQFWAGGG